MRPVSVSGLAAFAVLVVFSSKTTVCPPSGTKTSRKRCVYNHGNSYLFRFTYTCMQITVHPRDFVGDKNFLILNSQMLAFFGTLFILAIKIFIS